MTATQAPPPDPEPDDTVLDSETIADELGVHIQTVQRLFRSGELRGRKIGRRGWITTRGEFRAWITGAHPDAAVPRQHPIDPLEIKS